MIPTNPLQDAIFNAPIWRQIDAKLRYAMHQPLRPPGPPIARAALNMRQFFSDQVGFVRWLRQTYGPLCYVGLGRTKFYIVSEPELIHEVLVTRTEDFDKDLLSTRDLVRIVGQGLLTSRGEQWRKQRKMAAPHLKRAQISAYAKIMAQATQAQLDRGLRGERDLQQEMMAITLPIVIETLFGAALDVDLAHIERTISALLQDFDKRQHSLYRFVPPGLPTPQERSYRAAMDELNAIIDGIISAKRASLAEALKEEDEALKLRDLDLLSHLLLARDEQGQGMSDEQLRDEALTIFVAGHETTALTLAYALYELGKLPDWQAAIRAELAQLNEAQRQDPSTWLSALPKTRAVLMESLRMHPPAWILSREATHETTLSGWTLPKHSQIIISPYLLHHDERFYDQPERFNPQRWEDGELERTLPKHAFMPFGAGPRVCIGNHFAMMEAIIALAMIVEQRQLTASAPAQVSYAPAITLRPGQPLTAQLSAVSDDSTITGCG